MEKHKVKENEMFIFSADTNIINSGVFMFKASTESLDFINNIIEIGPTLNLGMGYENTAFAIGLVGCDKNSNRIEREACYNRSDFAYLDFKKSGSKKLIKSLMDANRTLIDKVIAPNYINFIHVIPQNEFNSYKLNTAKYIVHFPNTQGKKRMQLLNYAVKYLNNRKKVSCL